MNDNGTKSSKNSKEPLESSPKEHYTTEPLDTARVEADEKRSSQRQTQEKGNKESGKRDDSNKVRDIYTLAASNKEQTIAYILLILGLLLLLFFNNLLGGLIIGMVAGYYFAPEIIHYIRNLNEVTKGQEDPIRYIVLAALLLGLFIAAPGIFIGALIVATFKQVMAGPHA
jgi:hypothetical protein